MSTLRLEIFSDFVTRLATAEWGEVDFDGEPILCADVGEIGFTVYPERSPVEWATVVHVLDGSADRNKFVIRGEAEHGVAAAKESALDAGPTMMDRVIQFMLGIEDD